MGRLDLHVHVIDGNSPWRKKTYHYYLIFGEIVKGKEPWREEEWFNAFEPLLNSGSRRHRKNPCRNNSRIVKSI